MKRHLRWIIPVLCIPAVCLMSVAIVSSIARTPGFQQRTELGLLNLCIVLVALVAIIVAIVLAIVGGIKTYRAWRRRRGHLSPAESAQQLRAVHTRIGWNAAAQLRSKLLRREVPPIIQVWGVVPEPGEVFFYDMPVRYQRYHGQDVTYELSGGLLYGHPAFVAAGVAASTIGNVVSRHNAESRARTQWRGGQETRVLITSHRLVCLVPGGWMSFHYSAMTAVYPEVREGMLVCEFNGGTAPLRLFGPNAPIAAVMTVLGTHGLDAVAQHPSLRALDVALTPTADQSVVP